jgi:hypothetical protein
VTKRHAFKDGLEGYLIPGACKVVLLLLLPVAVLTGARCMLAAAHLLTTLHDDNACSTQKAMAEAAAAAAAACVNNYVCAARALKRMRVVVGLVRHLKRVQSAAAAKRPCCYWVWQELCIQTYILLLVLLLFLTCQLRCAVVVPNCMLQASSCKRCCACEQHELIPATTCCVLACA